MKIQHKIFILLLLFGIAPLITASTMGHIGTIRLGKNISNEVLASFTDLVRDSLLRTAENYAEILKETKVALELALMTLVKESEKAIAFPPSQETTVFLATDFDDPDLRPQDLVTRPLYRKQRSDNLTEPQPVSFNHPVFYLAPGIRKETVKEDILKISGVIDTMKELKEKFADTIQWIYVSLNTGVHISYPGHGGYPPDYDPRKRPWYKKARKNSEWIYPIVDATTRTVTFTVCQKIFSSNGSFEGVAALDIPITEVLFEKELSMLWSKDMKSFLVTLEQHPETGKNGLKILAQREYQKNIISWRGLVETIWIPIAEDNYLINIVSDLKSGKSGVVETNYQDKPSIIGYASIGEQVHLMVIVPKSVVASLPQKATHQVMKHTRHQLGVTSIVTTVVLIIIALSVFLSSRNLSKTLLTITDAVDRLARGDFSVRLNMRTNDERDKMIDAFNSMIPKLEDQVRLHQTIDLAREVQQNLLPRSDPKVKGLDIAGTSIYCDETGGDYFDYFKLHSDENRRIAIVVGDVSDHGLPAALLMATARSCLKQRLTRSGELWEVITDLNRQLTEDVEVSGRFMTLFFVEIDAVKKELKWVRAGHEPGIIYDPNTGKFEDLLGPGIPLGVDIDWHYQENQKINLKAGQVLLIGTDGIWETRNSKGDMFGKKIFCKVIQESAHLDAKDILNAVLTSLSAFQSDTEKEDDVTLVVVKFPIDQ
jgi:sigma-B regulation protein RsbU (phosphoserine phosphatase)